MPAHDEMPEGVAPLSTESLFSAKGEHRHRSELRGQQVIPHPDPTHPLTTTIHLAYAGQIGRIHEVVTMQGQQLAKVGFADKRIVYYRLGDVEIISKA